MNLLFPVAFFLSAFSFTELDISSYTPSVNSPSTTLNCSIDSIDLRPGTYNCAHNGTNDASDDTIGLAIRVYYTNKPDSGTLELTGTFNASKEVSTITENPVIFWGLKMIPNGAPVNVTAAFSADTSCTLSDDTLFISPPNCTRCQPYVSPGSTPACFPRDTSPCDISINFSPHPDYPEHTPIRYIQVVLHVFQKEDPNDPTKADPVNPGNWTIDDTTFFKSWFDDSPGNVNDFLGNLCLDNSASSPYISDSRIRFVNNAQVGTDLFFHPDNEAWGIGLYIGSSCGQDSADTRYGNAKATYVDNVSNPINAYHVFLSGGTWIDNTSAGIIGEPDSLDCYPGCVTGFTTSTGDCSDMPVAIISGAYKAWVAGNDPDSIACETSYPGTDAALSGGILGEFLHIISIDHNGGNFHWQNNNFGDSCDDTPDVSDNNFMDCTGGKCALTECQLGRAHYYLSKIQPKMERYPTGGGGFSESETNCYLSDPDIVIEDGQDIYWSGHRQIRSNIVVESGGRLTINCDIGMPVGGRITVHPNGRLIINGAKIYNSCDGRWDGIVVMGNSDQHQSEVNGTLYQGHLELNTGTVIQGAVYGARMYDPSNSVDGSGGIIDAEGTIFLNNITAVDFSKYQNYSPGFGKPVGNLSRFSNCQFLIDDNFPGDEEDFKQMVRLHRVTGIRFLGCHFANELPENQLSYAEERGYGIVSFDSEFFVRGLCQASVTPCPDGSYGRASFSGFGTAIRTANKGSVNTFRVTKTDFLRNARGIHAGRVDQAYIVDNYFDVGTAVPYSNGDAFRGIELYQSTGFKVEENTLRADLGNIPQGTKVIGIVCIAAGRQPNEVYRNILDTLDIGNLSNGKNRNAFNPVEGLEYLCNDNTDNGFDFAVPDSLYSGLGIASQQGSQLNSAGNIFTDQPSKSEGHLLNKASNFSYYYDLGERPDSITTGKVFLVLADEGNDCPSRLPNDDEGGFISESEKQQFEEDFYSETENKVRTYAANMLIRNYLIDTVEIGFDSVRTWLSNKADLESAFALVDSWIQVENPDSAQQALDTIPIQFSLSGDDLTEYIHFDSLKSIQINALENSTNEAQMVASHQNRLVQIANAGNYYASVQAQNLLNAVNGISYEPDLILPMPEPQGLITPPPGINNLSWHQLAWLNAAPNPVKNLTEFRYRLPENWENGQIVIYSLNGQTIKQIEVGQSRGSVNWDTKTVPEGVYLYGLVINGKKIITKRLVIIR